MVSPHWLVVVVLRFAYQEDTACTEIGNESRLAAGWQVKAARELLAWIGEP